MTRRVNTMQVGSDPTAAEVQAVKDYVQEHRAEVKVVQADWLRSCGELRTLLIASNGYSLPLSSLMAPPARLSPDKQEAQRGQAGTKDGGQGVDSSGPQARQRGSDGGEEGEDAGAAVGSQGPKHQALKGFW